MCWGGAGGNSRLWQLVEEGEGMIHFNYYLGSVRKVTPLADTPYEVERSRESERDGTATYLIGVCLEHCGHRRTEPGIGDLTRRFHLYVTSEAYDVTCEGSSHWLKRESLAS